MKSPRIGMISKYVSGLPLLVRCQLEGSETLLYTTKKKTHQAGDGLVDQTDNLGVFLKWKPDGIIMDCTGLGTLADTLIKMGLPVYGGSSLHDSMEFDRNDFLSLCEHVGIHVPSTFTTKHFKEAIAYVQKKKEPFALKIEGEKYAGSSYTYVGKSVEDTLEMLEIYREHIKGTVTINVQDVKKGVEVSTEGFFDGKQFLPDSVTHTFERKKFMEGDLGPAIGCAGDCVMFAQGFGVFEKGLQKLQPALSKLEYYGQIDLNTIVDEDGKVWALESTTRFGYNAIFGFMNLLKMPLSDFLMMAARRTLKKIPHSEDFALSVTLSVPPFPQEKGDGIDEGIPILGVGKEDLVRLNPMDMCFDGDRLRSGAHDGWIASPVGVGKTIEEARQAVYWLIDRMIVPNLQYRRDIGINARKSYNRLKSQAKL